MKKTLLTSKTLAILVCSHAHRHDPECLKGEPTQSEQSQPGTQQSEQYTPPTQGSPGEPAQKDQGAKQQQ